MAPEPICTVEQGHLKGKIGKNIDGKEFLSFSGIPFAKPPVGNLRFKDPQEPEKWQGIRDATEEKPGCLSMGLRPGAKGLESVIEGSDDCLYLNVYTHQLLKDISGELKPVMVFIHGGGFTSGSGSTFMYGPQILMTEDIVLVTINYRTGALGFLAFEDQTLGVPGNAGLKDQVQALKWIQKNIKQFGGNPDNVTIFGESAGGASIHFLLLSPLAKGLYHKAIAQSGSSLNPWCWGKNDPKSLAKELGCQETDEAKILQFLQSKPAVEIYNAQKKMGDWLDAHEKRNFSPSIEKNHSGAFISDNPMKIISSGSYNQVPLMIGYTSSEGMLVELARGIGFSINTEEFVPYFLGLKKGEPKYEELNKKICKFYFGSEKADPNNKKAIYDVLTDITFLIGISGAVKFQAKTSKFPIYYYRMSLSTKLNALKAMMNLTDTEGACHGDDLGYLFLSQLSKWEPGPREATGSKRFVKMWTNFARTGKPIPVKDSLLNVDWKPVSQDTLHYLDIGDELVPGVNPDNERVKFWEDILKDMPVH